MSSPLRTLSVEHVAFFSMFASTLLEPIGLQYIYKHLMSEQRQPNLGNSSQSYDNHSCSNRPDIENDELFREAFNWFLYLKLATAMPALFVTPLLGSWSDKIGRKVAFLVPSFGAILQAILCALIFNFKLQIELLFIGSVICGIAGYTTTFNAGCLAYVSDITSKSQRTLRVTVVNTCFGIGSGLAGFIGVYLLKYDTQLHSIWVILGLQVFIALYVILFLKETVIHELRRPLKCKHLLSTFTVFFLEPGNERRWRLLAYVAAFALSEIVISGTNKFFQYYAFSWPLCFSKFQVGYFAGALSLCYLSSLSGVRILQMLEPYFTNNWIIEVGFLSYSGGLLLAAFANSSLMLFLVPLVQALGLMPLAVLRACMSKLVDQEEQGALFAAVGCIESVALFVGASLFNAIYRANIPTMSGFPFIVGSLLLLVPAFLVGLVQFHERPTSFQLFLEASTSGDNEYWRQCSVTDSSPILPALSQGIQANYQSFES